MTIISGPQAFQIADTEQQLRNATERISNLIDLNNALHKKLERIPYDVLEHVTYNFGSPCDDGLAAFCDDAELNMPNQYKSVTLRWAETVYYEATHEVECEWDGDRYFPTDESLQLLREQSLSDSHDREPIYDSEQIEVE